MFPSGALIMAVPSNLPVKNARELLEYSRKNPANMGSYAAGAWPHMIADTWNQTEKTNIVTANYRGETPMWVDLVSGQVQMAVGSLQGILPHVQRGAGAIRIPGRRPVDRRGRGAGARPARRGLTPT